LKISTRAGFILVPCLQSLDVECLIRRKKEKAGSRTTSETGKNAKLPGNEGLLLLRDRLVV
jgi:hypothetical protein